MYLKASTSGSVFVTLENEYETLECMIDKFGLSNVLDAIARICIEKSEHVLVNYNDKSTSRAWDRAHKPIMQTAHHASVTRVSD